jgi:hypothetical protein
MASEVLEELDLTQGALGQDLLAEDIGDLLDGDTLVALVVDSGAVGAHEQLLVDDPANSQVASSIGTPATHHTIP